MKTSMSARDYANDRLAGFNESRERQGRGQVGGGRMYVHAGFKALKVELDLNFQIGEKYVFRDLRIVEVKYVGFPERGLPGFGKTKVVGMEILDDPTGFGGKNDGSVQYGSGKLVRFFKTTNKRMGLFMKAHDFHGKCLTTLDDYLEQKDTYLAQLDNERSGDLERQKSAKDDAAARQKAQQDDVFRRQEAANTRSQMVRGDAGDERAAYKARMAAKADAGRQRGPAGASDDDEELPEGWHNMNRRAQKQWRKAQSVKKVVKAVDIIVQPNSSKAAAPAPAKQKVQLPDGWDFMRPKQRRKWKRANNYDSDSD